MYAKKIEFVALKNYVKGLPPQTQDPFELNPHSQLIIWYHWLMFLNQVHKELQT